MQLTDSDQRITQLELLRDLSKDSLKKVLQKTRQHTATSNEVLFTQGVNDKTYIYLLEGDVELQENGNTVRKVIAGSEEALSPLAHKHPREFTARACSPAKYISIESQTLDMLIAWENQANYEVKEVEENPASNEDDWLLRLLAKPIFNRASPRQLQTLFNHFDPLKVSAGKQIVSQGSQADFFYILISGKAAVTHKTTSHPAGLKLAILNPGDTFGEDALISGRKRNASVIMTSDGMVIRLAPDQFKSFLEHIPNQDIAFDEAMQLTAAGKAQWLDVRLPNEFKKGHPEGAINLPLILLRVKMDAELSPNKHYILCCDDGRRSAAGTFLLCQRGYHVSSLRGGLSSQPNQVEALYTMEESA